MTIELSKLLEALYTALSGTSSYYNKATGAIEWDIDFDPRFQTEAYIALPDGWKINESGMILEFIQAQKPDDAEFLDMAFHGRGAHAHFRTSLYQRNLENAWFEFRFNHYVRIAEEWCEMHGISLIRDQDIR